MLPSDTELQRARLARMRFLLEALDTACAHTAELRHTLESLKSETDAIRASLQSVES